MQQRRLDAAETEIQRVPQPGPGQRYPVAVRFPLGAAGLRHPLDFRAAGKAQPQDAGGLVESLPRRIVAGAPYQPVVAMPLHQQQVGMPAGGHQAGQRKAGVGRRVGFGEPGGVDVALQMVHAQQRHIQRPGDGFGGVEAGQQRPGQPRPVGYGHRVDVLQPHPAIAHRPLQRRRQVANVLPRGQLRHHAAIGRMELRLRRDDVRPQDAPVFHHPGRRFVAGSFNAQNLQRCCPRQLRIKN